MSVPIVIKNSDIDGVGVFSVYGVPKDTILGVVIDNKGVVTYVGSKINHSYNPTTRLVFDLTTNQYLIVSNRTINANEEITADYNFTPDFIMKPDPSWK